MMKLPRRHLISFRIPLTPVQTFMLLAWLLLFQSTRTTLKSDFQEKNLNLGQQL